MTNSKTKPHLYPPKPRKRLVCPALARDPGRDARYNSLTVPAGERQEFDCLVEGGTK